MAWLGSTPGASLSTLLVSVTTGVYGAFMLLMLYGIRSLVFFPSTVLTLFAGWAFGPWLGSLLAWLGVLLSAAVVYGLARWVGGERWARFEQASSGRFVALQQRLRERAFRAVLIARLAALPGDVVNVLAGTSRTPFVPFAVATGIGGLPGLLAVVLAGASIEGVFQAEQAQVRIEFLVASLLLAVVTAVLSLRFRPTNPPTGG